MVKFEDYVKNRVSTVKNICEFAGCNSSGAELINANAAYNVTSTRAKIHPLVSVFQKSYVYRHWIKALIGVHVRQKMKSLSEVKNNSDNSDKSELPAAHQKILLDVFIADYKLLTGIYPNAPNWDLTEPGVSDEVRTKNTEKIPASQ